MGACGRHCGRLAVTVAGCLYVQAVVLSQVSILLHLQVVGL